MAVQVLFHRLYHQDEPGAMARSASRVVQAVLLAVAFFGLYCATLAPTVLWADDGHLQLQAFLGDLRASAGSHPLWTWMAHQFTRLPWGEVAWRVNLVSAVWGGLTVGLLYLFVVESGVRPDAALLAVVAFGVSHTFWSHAVRAEVYTLTLAFMVLVAWLALRWYRTSHPSYLWLATFFLGLGLAAHVKIVLYVPALLWLVFKKRPWNAKVLAGAVLAGLLGTVPWLWLLVRDAQQQGFNLSELFRWAFFTFEGYDFGGTMFDFSVRGLARDLFNLLAYLALQFFGLALIAGFWGLGLSWKRLRWELAIYLLLLYLGVMVFAFSYRVGDQYVFYMPSYIPFVVWIGLGFEAILARVRPKQWWQVVGLLLLLVGMPIGVYRLAPELVAQGVTFRDTRHVPGPKGKYFFLWPPKNGYQDARNYAESVLEPLPPNTLLLAEPVLSSPVTYLQVVEGLRPDVTVRYCCWDIEQTLSAVGDRPIAIIKTYPDLDAFNWLREKYELQPYDKFYLLRDLPSLTYFVTLGDQL